jgi:hypothetical protein
MLEYVVGPVLALLLGMKFTHYSLASKVKQIEELEEKVRVLDEQTAKKMQATVVPLAQAVVKINSQLGL